ncbi:MAG: glycosyltransferase family 1 protein [Lachnospiraceae bacterium]|nr:glycosyltransferase family 1 protein [Lachnospiraceae bacterium]
MGAKRVLLFDDKFGKINSHWPYSTENIVIEDRIYYDNFDFAVLTLQKLRQKRYEVFGFSGRGAPKTAYILDELLKDNQVIAENRFLRKVFKLHNTNLSILDTKIASNRELLYQYGNDWVRAALQYPFDVLLVQTYDDSDIFNRVLGRKSAYWIPYCYNDHLYYPRCDEDRTLDIGAFFKIERHDHRIEFVKMVKEIADRNGYSFEFSDKYWGEEYAKKICTPKIMIHLSYCGDIPWRLYECAASKTCLLTDPLGFNIAKLFTRNVDYYEYKRDFSDLEVRIKELIEDNTKRNNIANNAYEKVQSYTWEKVSTSLIYSLL